MKYKLTVVTTTYNQEDYIEQCIKGIVNQKTNFKFQFLISDDNSTDGTSEIIKKYKKKYPDIIKPIFRKKNLGPMENFINTLNEANTEYVALCDGDDFWTDNNKLQRQVDFLDANKDYNICFHRVKIFFEDGSQEPSLYPVKLESTPSFQKLLGENFMPANSVVYRWKYRKKDSFKNEFPKDIIPGDYFVHLLHAHDGKIHYINKVMSHYRRQQNGMWWMTSQPGMRAKFYLKNGNKMMNFYKEIVNKLNLPENTFSYTNSELILGMIEAYYTSKKFISLRRFYKENKKKYNETFIRFSKGLNLKNKIIYSTLTNLKILFKK